jgi:hypothetical protein
MLDMADRIVSLIPAETGWRAFYSGETDYEPEIARVVAWALLEDHQGAQRMVGMVVSGDDPTELVPAPDAVSETAPTFDRYGFKTDEF